ncbi:MAG: hypothetical protein KGJ13_04375 [Patescibacteria group bacterium]|nr:hypothetical protein [Patescibacteria group bacterium]
MSTEEKAILFTICALHGTNEVLEFIAYFLNPLSRDSKDLMKIIERSRREIANSSYVGISGLAQPLSE